jgi:hypothetical protein
MLRIKRFTGISGRQSSAFIQFLAKKTAYGRVDRISVEDGLALHVTVLPTVQLSMTDPTSVFDDSEDAEPGCTLAHIRAWDVGVDPYSSDDGMEKVTIRCIQKIVGLCCVTKKYLVCLPAVQLGCS